MAPDKELEIKLQFLDEAEDYLNTLETAILGIAQRGTALDQINAALRAAHSIKGGAGLMGYTVMSELAHRMEDALKVLKIQRDTLVIESDLEGQLLAAVDGIKQVIQCDRNQTGIDPHWLQATILPIFAGLYNILGEPDLEDANALLANEDSQDIIPVLFETEVEGCLERLATAIESTDPRLREEVLILAQELGGLGEMLQLSAFSQLCQSVESAIQLATETQVREVAQVALDTWRQSQALVLSQNFDQLPHQLTGLSFAVSDFSPTLNPSLDTQLDATFDPVSFDPVSFDPEAFDPEAFDPEAFDTAAFDAMIADASFGEDFFVNPNGDTNGSTREREIPIPTQVLSEATGQAARPSAERPFNSPETEFFFSQTADSDSPDIEPDATVRVSVRQLNELNDYFGELTIERHRLDSEVKRLRALVNLLNQRLRTLDTANVELREVYDKTSSASNPTTPLLLPAAANHQSPLALSHHFSTSTDGFDSLEMDQYDERHLPFRDMMETAVRLQEVADDIELSVDTTEQTARNLQRTSRQLQRNLSKLRMRPLSDITDRFPRALRELSLEYEKPVRLVLEGDNTLIDRNILEALSDPLMHILRNAFDHGIEDSATRRHQGKPVEGCITIKAQHRSNRTLITISDDGGGIPLEKIRSRAQEMGLDESLLAQASEADLLSLIFEPGFSTAHQVTALSGRGVGMDVVRNNLKKVRGDISVSTQPGRGTTFTISVPYTLSVTRVLLSESNHMPLAFPTDNIQEITVVNAADCYIEDGHEMFTWRDQPARLVKMSQWLAFNCPRQIEGLDSLPNISIPSVLIFRYNEQCIGLQIDRSWGEQEVAVRRVEGNILLPAGFGNCTILGDGKVVPLVNVPDLLRWIFSCEGSNIQSASSLYGNPLLTGSLGALGLPTHFRGAQQPVVLVIDDSVNVRRLLALTLEKQGYQVVQAKDGLDALEKLDAGIEVHAIVCDIEMPRLDGYGFLAKLRANQNYGQLPITMLTSRTGDKHRKLAMKLGANAYFSKPYREQALLKTLEDAVRPVIAS